MQGYVRFMTYKLVHYLGMAARQYVRRIKLNWVLNDVGQIYLNKVLSYETTQIPIIPLKFSLPSNEREACFYKDADKYLQLYEKLRCSQDQKRRRIRAEILKSKEDCRVRTQDFRKGRIMSKT